jgi:RNA polymerase sigma-70 factor (ECF subfamily)
MIRDEMEAAVYKVMRGMPKDVLKALTLRERDRFPYRKIAKVMKCRLGTVKSRIARARGAIDRGVHPFMQHE